MSLRTFSKFQSEENISDFTSLSNYSCRKNIVGGTDVRMQHVSTDNGYYHHHHHHLHFYTEKSFEI